MLMTQTAQSSGTIKIRPPRLHSAQQVIKRGMGRFNVVNCGRRFGKDILGQDRAIYYALKLGKPVAWFAPSYRMLSDNYRMLYHTLQPVVTRKQDNTRLELVTGGVIDFWSLDTPDRARGRKYIHAVINEAAMVDGLMDAWNLVIRPTLIDYNGTADFYSTPRGLNDFYSLYAQAVDLQDWERFTYTSYDNPHIPASELDALRDSVPERVYRQEVLAEFLEDGAYFQGIAEAAIVEQPDTPADHPGHHFVAGLDWAISQDYTVLTIACRECNRVVDWDRFNRIDFTYQRERVVNHLSRWGAIVLPERNSIGLPNIELIRDRVRVMSGIDGAPGFNTLPSTKPLLIQRLASGLEHDGFKIPCDYADEFRQYQIEILPSGHTRFSAPDGRHDDRVISAALAYWALTSYTALPAQPAHQSRWAEYGIEQTEQGDGSKWRRY